MTAGWATLPLITLEHQAASAASFSPCGPVSEGSIYGQEL